MKNLANGLSISRIFLSLVLLFIYANEWLFIGVYLVCGVSDVLDGYIARKTNTQSIIGAKLDSVADLVMFSVIMALLIIWMKSEILIFIPWIISIFAIRVANILIAAFKYRKFVLLHTWANKFTGLLTFITPALYVIFQATQVFLPICFIAVLSAIEEGIIHLTTNKPDLNRRSIFFRP